MFVKTSIPRPLSTSFASPVSYRSSNLRERGHSFRLPDYDVVLFKKSFIVRCLCKLVTHNYITTNYLFLFVFLYYQCVVMCVCRILIRITYLLAYKLRYQMGLRPCNMRRPGGFGVAKSRENTRVWFPRDRVHEPRRVDRPVRFISRRLISIKPF